MNKIVQVIVMVVLIICSFLFGYYIKSDNSLEISNLQVQINNLQEQNNQLQQKINESGKLSECLINTSKNLPLNGYVDGQIYVKFDKNTSQEEVREILTAQGLEFDATRYPYSWEDNPEELVTSDFDMLVRVSKGEEIKFICKFKLLKNNKVMDAYFSPIVSVY